MKIVTVLVCLTAWTFLHVSRGKCALFEYPYCRARIVCRYWVDY